jgi:hypothetical protein
MGPRDGVALLLESIDYLNRARGQNDVLFVLIGGRPEIGRLKARFTARGFNGWASGFELKPRPRSGARSGPRRAIGLLSVLLCMALASLFSSCQGDGSVNSLPSVHSHSVVLTWDASTSTDVVGYNVYRSSVSGGPYALLSASIPAGTLTYTDTTVQAGRTYYYVVTAVDSGGNESAYSNEASALVPSP